MGSLLVDPTSALYVVMAVALVVWLGLFACVWGLDRKVRRLERQARRDGSPPSP